MVAWMSIIYTHILVTESGLLGLNEGCGKDLYPTLDKSLWTRGQGSEVSL